LNDVWNNVRLLQKTLKVMWYFNANDTAYFWPITHDALTQYQIKRWIINHPKELWAWVFGPKTKEHIRNELIFILERKIFKEKNLLTYIN